MERAKKKGTVLLTVVGVMLVLAVFLISTLVLTSAANRRSYYTYYETQAQYAAQAALDAVTNSAYSNKSFYDWVSEKVVLGEDPKPITVDFSDTSGIQFSNNGNVVNCTIERIPDNYVWDTDTRAIHAQRAWKITATASVGTGRNQADYTVCNYIYENYRAPEEGLNSGIQNTASSRVNSGTVEEDDDNKFIAIGTIQYNGGATNGNMVYFGPQVAGTSMLPSGRGNYDGGERELNNQNGAVGNILFCYGIKSNVHVVNEFQRKGETAVYYGNVVGGNSSVVTWSANIAPAYAPTSYNELNLVYVDGTMNPGVTNLIVGRKKNGTDPGEAGNYPVNLFAGSVNTKEAQTQKSVVVYGDAYLLDPELDSYWDGYNDNLSTIAAFVSNNINKANVNANMNAAVGGNIYSINKSLTLSGNKKKLVIDGNVVFANPGGTLTIQGNVEIKGKVICAGTTNYGGAITGAAAESYIDTGYAYYNANYRNAVPKGQVTYQKTYQDKHYTFVSDQWFDGGVGLWGPPSDGDGYTSNGWYTVSYTTRTENVTENVNYDFSLYPFAYRPDEIFERYYRWDLKQPSTVGAAQTVANAKNDNLVKESIACGHNWEGAELLTDVNGASYYVPYTFPVNTAHILIDKYEVADPAGAVAALNAANYPIYETEASFKAAMGATAAANTITTSGGTGVTICYHKNDGTADTKPAAGAKLVTESCVLNVVSGTTVVIDPSQRANKKVPLYIYMTGGGSADVLINNTANYSLGANQPTPYYNDATGTQGTLAQHGEVVIFLDPSMDMEKMSIMTTGMYGRLTGGAGASKTGDLYIVQNPIYPADANFQNQDDAFKFAYELVPNAILLGIQNKNYSATNGLFWNAEVIMPTSTLTSGTMNFNNASVYYREEWNSITRDNSTDQANCYLAGVGGSMTKQMGATGDPKVAVAYIGDSHRKVETVFDYDTNSSDLGADNKDFLHNNYQGAN